MKIHKISKKSCNVIFNKEKEHCYKIKKKKQFSVNPVTKSTILTIIRDIWTLTSTIFLVRLLRILATDRKRQTIKSPSLITLNYFLSKSVQERMIN